MIDKTIRVTISKEYLDHLQAIEELYNRMPILYTDKIAILTDESPVLINKYSFKNYKQIKDECIEENNKLITFIKTNIDTTNTIYAPSFSDNPNHNEYTNHMYEC